MKGRKSLGLASVGFFLYFAPGVFAQTVQFGVTSGTAPNGTYGIMGGVYTSPYTGSINGQSVAAICDDFYDDVTPPEYWTAIATNLSKLGPSTTNDVYFEQGGGGSKLGGTQQQYDYMVLAILAEKILITTDETAKGYLSFALWEVFDPAAANNLNSSQKAFAAADLLAAQNAVNTGITNSGSLTSYLNTFSNVTLYSATTDNGLTVEKAGTPGRPQEFIVVNMAEPLSPALLGVDLLGVVALVIFVRRRLATI